MERKPHSTGSIVGAVVLFVVVLLGLYVGGYFALGKYAVFAGVVNREYRYNWLACCYRPMAGVESVVIGREVVVDGPTWGYGSDGVTYERDP